VSAPGLPAALAGLLDPAAYAHRPVGVELRETHISWVLLAGKLAFKLKKPLRLPFLDYSTLDRRRVCALQESHDDGRTRRRHSVEARRSGAFGFLEPFVASIRRNGGSL
jgi:hypothetical protein